MDKNQKGIVAEFKKFITRGNIVDMAVGIIVGSAFTAIVTSFVNDILMPLIALVKKDGFTGMYFGIIKGENAVTDVTLANGAIIAAGEPTYRTYVYYGNFIQAVLNFFLIALSIFFIVKVINKVREKSDAAKAKLAEKLHKETVEVEESKVEESK